MGAWDVANTIFAFISRFPLERLVPQRTADKDLEEMAKRVEQLSQNPTPLIMAKTPTDEIKSGTAGNLCSDEHVVQAASDIAEALRMARRPGGIRDPEVRRRLKAARDELNQMERYDIVAEKIVTYPAEQAETARWLLPKSAAIRHTINEILMRDKTIEDLEKLSAYASGVASELTDKIDSLPKEQKERDACLEIKRLPQFLEEIRARKGKTT